MIGEFLRLECAVLLIHQQQTVTVLVDDIQVRPDRCWRQTKPRKRRTRPAIRASGLCDILKLPVALVTQ